jgi:hypothetical protein
MPIKGLIFDAYGTLYDVHSVQTKTEQLCPGKGDLITQIWRLKQLGISHFVPTIITSRRPRCLFFPIQCMGSEGDDRDRPQRGMIWRVTW